MWTLRVRHSIRVAALGLVLVLGARPSASPLPARLTDAEFWKLETDLSEPGGYFRITDNYTSNEREVGQLFTMLRDMHVQGGVYLGVGPEQNLSYIASVRPTMAFILDIRRQAVMQHLMFKAVFELARDRAEFISILFSKPRPAGMDAAMPIQKIWDAFVATPTDAATAAKNRARIVEHLTRTHGFSLTADESAQLTSVIDAFASFGPSITTRGTGGGGGNGVNFADLTGWSYDAAGVPQSFLSTDEHYQFVKKLQEQNLVVPVSGDFGGPKALRAIGAYLHQQGGVVSAFYVSNVEQYLFQDGKERAFYDNVATLPISPTSVFIRPYSMRRGGGGPTQSLCGIAGFLAAVKEGHVYGYNDTLSCAR